MESLTVSCYVTPETDRGGGDTDRVSRSRRQEKRHKKWAREIAELTDTKEEREKERKKGGPSLNGREKIEGKISADLTLFRHGDDGRQVIN